MPNALLVTTAQGILPWWMLPCPSWDDFLGGECATTAHRHCCRRVLAALSSCDHGSYAHDCLVNRLGAHAGLLPFYMVGTIGTTSSCAVDPIAEMGAIAQNYKIW